MSPEFRPSLNPDPKALEQGAKSASRAPVRPRLDLRNKKGIDIPPQEGWDPETGLPNGGLSFKNPHAFRLMVGPAGNFIRAASKMFKFIKIRYEAIQEAPTVVTACIEVRGDSRADNPKAIEERKLVSDGLREEKDHEYLPKIDQNFSGYLGRVDREANSKLANALGILSGIKIPLGPQSYLRGMATNRSTPSMQLNTGCNCEAKMLAETKILIEVSNESEKQAENKVQPNIETQTHIEITIKAMILEAAEISRDAVIESMEDMKSTDTSENEPPVGERDRAVEATARVQAVAAAAA
ncbi:hypothetical protein BKA65DRAFT_559304 [Rhexocercosporidium sp. MPI-PUGE-AT-0058]|nr:hypothetical protein BKA65DRAFT_559304 [Rhexocercosporidium sp. MPI-PUGE-AT-0058]